MTLDEAVFPDRPEVVTAAWLTDVLQPRAARHRGGGHGGARPALGTTGRVRLGLEHADGSDGPAIGVREAAAVRRVAARMVAATDMGRREARFYAGPAAEVPMRIPRAPTSLRRRRADRVRHGARGPRGVGCTFTNRLEPHDAERARQQLIESLGRLHAHFWDDPRFDDELVWVQPAMRGSYGAKLVDQRPRAVRAEVPAGVRRALRPLRRAPRADHRAVGRGRAHADPRRHPRSATSSSTTARSASTTGP